MFCGSYHVVLLSCCFVLFVLDTYSCFAFFALFSGSYALPRYLLKKQRKELKNWT